MNVEKLKNKARKFEEKGNVAKAVEHYVQVLDGLGGTPEITAELALFNKVGDLYLKLSKVPEAVDMYERAVGLYAEQGFPNNAIALCNKILRNAPGRTHVYLRLAQLMVERGFVAEAKQNLLEYADRMQTAGKTDEAFRALKEFADLSPDNEEIRLLLAEQLKAAARDAEAREQLEKLYAEANAHGDDRKRRSTLDNIRAIDPEFDEERAAKKKVETKKQKSSELVFLDVEYETARGAPAAAPAPAPPPRAREAAAPVPPPPPDDEPVELAAAEPEIEPDADAPAADVDEMVVERISEEVEPEDVDVQLVEGLDAGRTFESSDAEIPSLEIESTSLVEGTAPAEIASGDVEDIELEPAEEAPEPVVEDAGLPLIEVESDEEIVLEPKGVSGEIEVPDLDFGASMDDDLLTPPPDAAAVSSAPAPDPAAPFERESDDELTILDEFGAEVPDTAPALEEPEPALDLAGLAEEVEAEDAAAPPSAPEPEPIVAEAPDLDALQAAVADDPDHAGHHIALGEALVGVGERERGVEELAIAVDLYEAQEEWSRAAHLSDEILRLEPSLVKYHQKRVEFVYHLGDRAQLLNAYLSLADALFRSGAVDRAAAVYRRVLEHEPDNPHARQALASLEPETPEPAAPEASASPAAEAGDFVDLGAMILEEEPVRDTRMRVEDEEPTGDEERDFAEMLSQFKRGIEQNLDDSDWQAHYDLGIAFKEMGLLDEAIAEFQKALRSPQGRLRTAEALGACFFDKGQFSVAGTVMRRAVESDTGGDESKIGLLYWMARCEEEQQRVPEALALYQRVFALDINFHDVSDRVKQLARVGS